VLASLPYRIWRRSRVDLERAKHLDDVFSTIAKCLAVLGEDDVKDTIDKGAFLLRRHLVE
jgi:hypothetical protein